MTEPVAFVYVRQVRNGKEVAERWTVLDYESSQTYWSREAHTLPNGRPYASLILEKRPDPDRTTPPKKTMCLFLSDLADLPEAMEILTKDLGINITSYHLAEV